jgi:hypothetical protein
MRRLSKIKIYVRHDWLFDGAPDMRPQSSPASRIIAFHRDSFASQLMLTFPRLRAPIRRPMVKLMTALADRTSKGH